MKPGAKLRKTLTVLRVNKHGVPTIYAIDEIRYAILPEDVGKAVQILREKAAKKQ